MDQRTYHRTEGGNAPSDLTQLPQQWSASCGVPSFV